MFVVWVRSLRRENAPLTARNGVLTQLSSCACGASLRLHSMYSARQARTCVCSLKRKTNSTGCLVSSTSIYVHVVECQCVRVQGLMYTMYSVHFSKHEHVKVWYHM